MPYGTGANFATRRYSGSKKGRLSIPCPTFLKAGIAAPVTTAWPFPISIASDVIQDPFRPRQEHRFTGWTRKLHPVRYPVIYKGAAVNKELCRSTVLLAIVMALASFLPTGNAPFL